MDKVVALACVGYLGTCFSLLGAISVKLMPRLGIDKGRFGTLISVFMSVCLVASLVTGTIVDTFGYRPMAAAGFLLTASAIVLWGLAGRFVTALAACLVLGLGAMCLNTAGNTLIPMVLFEGKNPAGASNLGNVFFGLGLLLTPLVASWLFRRLSYTTALVALAALVLIPLPAALAATYPVSHAQLDFSRAFALMADPVVIVAGLILFCYFGLEASFAHWLTPFGRELIDTLPAEETARLGDGFAQRLLSWFALGMMGGRFLVSQVPAITKYGAWFIAAAAVAAAGMVLAMTIVRRPAAARVLAVFSGLVFGLCFPTTVGVTLSHYSKDIYGTVFGTIFAIGLVGCVIVPKAIGNAARNTSIQRGMRLLLPLCVALLILALMFTQL